MTLDEKHIKKYFSAEETVSKWWEPESSSASWPPEWLRRLFIQQRFILKDIFDPKRKTILDVGTGKGRFAIDLALAGAEQIYAIDISKDMLKTARDRASQVEAVDRIILQVGDAEHLPFDDDTFDATVCMETFCHLPNPQQAMNELARVTKRHGIVAANITTSGKLWRLRYRYNLTLRHSVFSPMYFSRFTGWLRPFLHKKLGYPLSPSKPLAKYFSRREFCSLFSNAGLQVFKIIEQGPSYSPVFLTAAAEKLE